LDKLNKALKEDMDDFDEFYKKYDDSLYTDIYH